ncbi:RB1-inducible coiled-coil protein 1 isoform X2 [Harmonia axyridis]|uniref:RB1-inducible coiled-coil protein 1 isoform X2 n=1 Tax=Harmonia axyridis TaxID=115357 RepID=UPI001E2771AA|nr:RB1-inducible coiled-coil protein 1 isoform X2 [Harmonia axyridis]
MTMEIYLKRPHSGVPWGFRLIGGSDSHLPIVVSKIVEGSVAEQSGLEEDVLLERINNVPTSGLTHAEVNQIILATEDELFLTVRKVNLENLILASLNEEDSNSEITNILRQAVNTTTVIEEETELEELGLKKEFGVTMIIDNNKNKSENQISKDKNIYTPHISKYQLPQAQDSNKKWTTFLQKPKNPKPTSKNQAPPIPKSEQYKVIITKQPKREKQEIKPQEIPSQEEIVEEKEDANTQTTEEIPMELEVSVKTHITEETEVTIEDADEELQNEMENVQYEYVQGTYENIEASQEDYIQYDSTENEKITTEVMIENSQQEQTLSLEEQLAAVQRQLQELAQLPSSIQETLSVVTQQLANIVGDKKPNTETDEDPETRNEEMNENTETVEAGEAEEVEEHQMNEGNNPELVIDEASDRAEMEGGQSDVLSDIYEEQEVSETTEEANYEEILAAQLEAQRIEEERQAKHQLVDEWNRKWPWCDTSKKVYKINFLKYTPPAKNLEYLQRSDVYRLVHDMEPPVRGISLRSEKILAAQDYYTAESN